jgi:Rad3-related DNA helicase
MQNADEDDSNDLKAENDKLKEEVGNVLRQISSMEDAMKSNVPYFFEVKEDINFRTKQRTEDWKVSLSPLDARGLFEGMLGKYAKKFLFVSATTGLAKHFKATHDLKSSIQQISLPSPFPPENRPVFSLRSGNMSYKTIEDDLPKMLGDIVKIVTASGNSSQNHAKQNGVIHTYNNKIMSAVVEKLYRSGLGDRVIELSGGGNQREAALQMFKEGSGKILVSPSAMLGLSFIDDIARYQIIAKVPYPSLADPSVKYRMDNIDGWYEWQVAKDLIQTFGRVCRSLTDWGTTYILDSKFQDFYKANRRLFPDYVQKAIQVR